MKETYFQLTNIRTEAEKIQTIVEKKSKRNRLEYPALLVLDMQRYFLEPESHAFVPSAPAIVPGIMELVTKFQSLDLPVIFTKHINTPQNAGLMAIWWRDLITSDNSLSKLAEPFQPLAEIEIEKSQYDGFLNTELDEILQSNAVTDVIITGVMTHLCCETTARSAFMYGYHVWFPIDGSATYTLDHHIGTVRNLSHGFANVILLEELEQMLSKRAR